MKISVLLFGCLLCTCFVNAQFSAGQKMIGGQVGAGWYNTNQGQSII